MAGNVRIVGPEFIDPRSREAFERVVDSIRQFSSHSRESISLARNPLKLQADHFVLLWPRGAAVVGCSHHGGRIRGGFEGNWMEDATPGARSMAFDNPLPPLALARKELLAIFQRTVSLERISNPAMSAEETLVVADDEPEDRFRNERATSITQCTRGIVLLTKRSDRVSIDELDDNAEFSILTLEQATARTIFHLPNLLRVIDYESSFFTPDEIAQLTDVLEEEAATQATRRIVPSDAPKLNIKKKRKRTRGGMVVMTAITLALAFVLFTLLFPSDDPIPDGETRGDSTSQAVGVRPQRESTVLLIMPAETQAFISEQQYQSRSDLIYAIGAGNGIVRLLPSKEQTIRMDSTKFAAGVYGYFKSDGAWRKGKLLQTLKPRDTIIIENFLPPLP